MWPQYRVNRTITGNDQAALGVSPWPVSSAKDHKSCLDFQTSKLSVNPVEVELFRVEAFAQPLSLVYVFGMLWVEDDFQEFFVAIRSAAILRRATALALQATHLARCALLNRFYADFMFPAITHIVFIDKAEAFAGGHIV